LGHPPVHIKDPPLCVNPFSHLCSSSLSNPSIGAFVKGPKDTYTRAFSHADVFVDLHNRTNSKVTFKRTKGNPKVCDS